MNKNKRAIIVHGWDYNPSMNWYPWLKKELENKGYSVLVPEMPNTSKPKISAWTAHLKSIIGNIDENTYLVGHSIGCQTIMRFLEKENKRITKAVFVAGWFKLDNLENEEVESIASPWLENNINYEKVKSNIDKLTVFLSSNDPYNCVKENKSIFEKELGAKVIILDNKGHFTSDDGVSQLRDVLKEFE